MAERPLCMGCMSPLDGDSEKCPRCGYPAGGINPPEYMFVRTVLADRYLVGRVLEVSGDSAVYLGLDQQDRSLVTIREFFPGNLCRRNDDGSPRIIPGNEGEFAAYKQKFLICARGVARLRDVLEIVPYFDIFEENGTAYAVSEYCEGMSLERYIHTNGPLSYEQARQLFLPLISAMATMHTAGVLHLGICPKNVLLDNEGRLRLKNFCIPETHTVNTACEPVLIAGYSAPEQYESGAVSSAASDVYGLATTFFFALTGITPPDATLREKKGDELSLPSDVAASLPVHVKDSLLRALRVSATYRTQSAARFWEELSATSAVAALIDEDGTAVIPDVDKKNRSGMGYIWFAFGLGIIALGVVAVIVLNSLGIVQLGKTTTTTTTTTTFDIPTTTSHNPVSTRPSPSGMVEADTVVGKLFTELLNGKLTGNVTIQVIGSKYSDQEAGTILEQTPAAGELVEKNGVISVIISAGAAKKPLPDVAGWDVDFTKLYLEALGYRIGDVHLVRVSKQPHGTVDRLSPAIGTAVPIGTVIDLYVSNVDPEPSASTSASSMNADATTTTTP